MRDGDIDNLTADGAQEAIPTRLAASGPPSPGMGTPAMTRQPGYAMSELDLADLRQKAEAATPRDQPGMTDADAEFFAAANPATILRLLDRLARAECRNHDPNTGPGSDWCPNCRQYEPAALTERSAT